LLVFVLLKMVCTFIGSASFVKFGLHYTLSFTTRYHSLYTSIHYTLAFSVH